MNSHLTIKDILIKSDDFLKNKGIKNSRLEAELLISHFLNLSRLDLYLKFDSELNEKIVDLLREKVLQRSKRMPLQYVINEVSFLDAKLYVDDNVLIPRPETEFLCDLLIKNYSDKNSFLDIGTGSGAIAISLALNLPNKTIEALDISEKALSVAKKNAKDNNAHINFFLSDLFQNVNRKYDLIISNPPYVSDLEYQTLESELFFEPKQALVSDNEGLAHIFEIIAKAPDYLNENGLLFIETGAFQSEKIKDFSLKFNYKNIDIIKDLNNFNRFVKLEI
jgi:release factor glutamine methyltransferase